MKRILLAICTLALFHSCAEQCNIAGNSTVGSLDGQMLYLRVRTDGAMSICMDSCQVVHGRFSFYSDVDTAVVAQLFMGSESVMPLVLESGNIHVEVDHAGQRVSGSPLNDRLYQFVLEKSRLENEQWELDQECISMMHRGCTPAEIHKAISPRAKKLALRIEELENRFIMDNYQNALGPGVFMLLFGQYPMPVITEQIEHILRAAPPSFMNDPFVDSYVRQAIYNQQGQNQEKE